MLLKQPRFLSRVIRGCMAEHDFSLETLVGLFDNAVNAIVSKGDAFPDEYSALPEVIAFQNAWAFQRYLGAVALNHLNMVLATKAVRQNPGSKLKTYVRLDAECQEKIGGVPKTASVIVSLDDLKAHIPIETEQFVNLDSPEVQEGIQRYLRTHKLWYSNRIFSHLEEHLSEDNSVICDDGYADFSPISTIRMVVPDVQEGERRLVEDIIAEELARRLADEKIIGKSYKVKKVKQDLEGLLGVGKGYPDLYSVFEQTRFFATNIVDALAAADEKKPVVLTVLAKNGTGHQQQEKERKRKNVIKLLEDLIASKIRVPYNDFEYGVKSLPSFANKILKNFMQRTHAIDTEELNIYLKERRLLPFEERDLADRDPRDLFRMSWIVHGSSVSYDLRSGHMVIPQLEIEALSKVYDIFLRFAEIPEEMRGYIETVNGKNERKTIPGWRAEERRRTSAGIIINPSSRWDVKDYIDPLNRKPNGFAQIKAYADYDGLGYEIPIEIQLMTNFMSTFNRLDRASHDAFKAKDRAIQEYLMQKNPLLGERWAAKEKLVTLITTAQTSPVSLSARS
jgi:hypothetical protein